MRIITMFRAFAAIATVALGLAAPAGAFAGASHHARHHHAAKNHRHHVRSRAAATSTTPAGNPEAGAPESGAGNEAPGAPEADGPGGHQDNPNDANADHQFNGQE